MPMVVSRNMLRKYHVHALLPGSGSGLTVELPLTTKLVRVISGDATAEEGDALFVDSNKLIK